MLISLHAYSFKDGLQNHIFQKHDIEKACSMSLMSFWGYLLEPTSMHTCSFLHLSPFVIGSHVLEDLLLWTFTHKNPVLYIAVFFSLGEPLQILKKKLRKRIFLHP